MGMKLGVILCVMVCQLFLSYGQGEAMGGDAEFRERIQEAYTRLDLTDGVSAEEAVIIAQHQVIELGIDDELKASDPGVRASKLVEGCWAVGFNARLNTRLKSGLSWYAVDVNQTTGEIKVSGWGPS